MAVQVGTATFVNPAAALDILDGLVALAESGRDGWPAAGAAGPSRPCPLQGSNLRQPVKSRLLCR